MVERVDVWLYFADGRVDVWMSERMYGCTVRMYG